MSEMSTETPAAPETTTEVSNEATPSIETPPVANASAPEIKSNPAWQPVLDVLPTSLHEVVAPTLKDWDRGVNERFREIHETYEPYKPYEELIQAGVPVEDIGAAMQFMQRLNEDPQSVYDAMREYYKFEQNAPVANAMDAVDPEHDPFADPNANKIQELEQQLQTLTQQIQQERTQAENAQQDKALETTLSSLETKYGAFDREYVLTQMAAGAPAEEAVKTYAALVEKIKTESNRPSAPTVVGGGSGGVATLPSTSGMSPQERKKHVADILRSGKDNG